MEKYQKKLASFASLIASDTEKSLKQPKTEISVGNMDHHPPGYLFCLINVSIYRRVNKKSSSKCAIFDKGHP